MDNTERSSDVINALADAFHQETVTCDEVLRPAILSQGNVQQMPSEKKAQPRINKAAQQVMFKKRQLHVELQNNSKEIINVKNDDCGQPHQRISGDSQKSKEITNVLLSDTAWLTCTVIDAAQDLLKVVAHDKFSGFQSVAVGRTMQFEIQEGEFIQILHCNSGHWVTMSTIGCKPSEVFMYDSMYSAASECVQCQIATLLALPSSHITLKFMDVQMQSGTCDCGLFAVAFATALVFGYNPGQYIFDQLSMRKHLWNCLRNQKISMFPVIKERRRKQKVKCTQQIPLYCSCRLPDISGIKLIECSKCKTWYHTNICVPVEKKYFSRDTEWICPKCRPL